MRNIARFLSLLNGLCYRHPLWVYAGFVAALAVVIVEASATLVGGAVRPVAGLLQLGDQDTPARPPATASAVLEMGDSWLDGVKSTFKRRDRGESVQSSLGAPPPALLAPLLDGTPPPERRISGTYRTMCVRLCDGYFYPVSFATTRDRFDDDEHTCQQSCSAPAKLYVYANPGGEPDDMVSISGQAYSKLPNAFRFRQTFDQACKCNAHPWETEAMARHRRYAEDASRKKQQQAAAETHGRKAGRAALQAAAQASQPQPALVVKVSPIAPETTRPLGALSGGSASHPVILNAAAPSGSRHGKTSPHAAESEKRGSRGRSAKARPDQPPGEADARPAKRSQANRFAETRVRGIAQR